MQRVYDQGSSCLDVVQKPLLQIFAELDLSKQALSGSGLEKGLHIIDPRTAKPVRSKHTAWSLVPDAASADAISTAFMIMSNKEIEQLCKNYPQISAMTASIEGFLKTEKVKRFGHFKGLSP